MKANVLLLMFICLTIISSALSDVPIAPFALLMLMQSLKARPVQGENALKTDIESSAVDLFKPQATVLSEKCSHLWDVLEPLSEEEVSDLSALEGTEDDGNSAVYLEKFQELIRTARDEGGSTRESMDLVLGKEYLPPLEVIFSPTMEEYGKVDSRAYYGVKEHHLKFYPALMLGNVSIPELSRVFIHELMHAAEALKNHHGLSSRYIKASLMNPKSSQRFSSAWSLRNINNATYVAEKKFSITKPYMGAKEKAIFDKEYKNCHSNLEKIYEAVVERRNFNTVMVKNTLGEKMSAETVLRHYQNNRGTAPFFREGFHTASNLERIGQCLGNYWNLYIGKSDYKIIGRCDRVYKKKETTEVIYSFKKTLHHFAATFFQFNGSLNLYPKTHIDAEKIAHVKEYYKPSFIGKACPGLERFFLGTNQRFKKDLIANCETKEMQLSRHDGSIPVRPTNK